MKELTCADLWPLLKSGAVLGLCGERCFVLYFKKKKKKNQILFLIWGMGIVFFLGADKGFL